MKRIVCLIFVIAIFILPIGSALSEDVIRIGTAGVTGVYYPAGGAICRFVMRGRKNHGIECYSESTQGSMDNLEILKQGKIEMAIVQSDWLYKAYHGLDSFEKYGANSDLRTIMVLHDEPLSLVVRNDSDIKKFTDIKNTKVNFGSRRSGTRQVVKSLLEIVGWSEDDFDEILEYGDYEQAHALCEGKIDVMAFMAGQPNLETKSAAARCDVRLIDVDQKILDKITKKYPYYSYMEIPKEIYKNNDVPVKSFGTKALLVSHKSLSDKIAYNVVKIVLDDLKNFQTLHPVFIQVKKENTINKTSLVPMHKGVLKYLKEIRR